MKRAFDDLPGWAFEIEEVSANVYEVTGTDKYGHRVQVKGTDLGALLDEARQGATRIQEGISSR
ncbi:MAG: hypothetical protein M3O50_02045 [Myxococcota bacterium]|nr:hypothetical protein [Myxococcota bacterium]